MDKKITITGRTQLAAASARPILTATNTPTISADARYKERHSTVDSVNISVQTPGFPNLSPDVARTSYLDAFYKLTESSVMHVTRASKDTVVLIDTPSWKVSTPAASVASAVEEFTTLTTFNRPFIERPTFRSKYVLDGFVEENYVKDEGILNIVSFTVSSARGDNTTVNDVVYNLLEKTLASGVSLVDSLRFNRDLERQQTDFVRPTDDVYGVANIDDDQIAAFTKMLTELSTATSAVANKVITTALDTFSTYGAFSLQPVLKPVEDKVVIETFVKELGYVYRETGKTVDNTVLTVDTKRTESASHVEVFSTDLLRAQLEGISAQSDSVSAVGKNVNEHSSVNDTGELILSGYAAEGLFEPLYVGQQRLF
jgi:hypothetical protein